MSAPAAKAAPAKAPAKPAATYSALQPQSDQQLKGAAQDIADTQVNGGLASLAQIMARNTAQSTAAQQTTAGLYQGLAGNVDKSNQQLGQIGAGLNSTLAGIGDQSQAAIGAGYQASPELTRLDAQGLGGGGVQALAAELARQKGYAAQDSQAFRSAGATQGANYGSLGASNLGTFSARGGEALSAISRAAQQRASKITDQQTTLEASRGPLFSQALGKLTDAEANRELARQTLGVKDTVAQTGVLNAETGAKAQQATATHLSTSDATAARRASDSAKYQAARVRIDQINTQVAQGHLTETQRHDLANEKLSNQRILAAGQRAAAKPGAVAAGPKQAAKDLTKIVGAIQGTFTNPASTHPQTVAALRAGYSSDEINIARDLALYGHVSAANKAAALRIVGGHRELLPPAWGV